MTVAILPPLTLVCHDTFGLGLTLGRVQRTSACASGKVDVLFDDDAFDPEAPEAPFTGRTRTVEDEGEAVVQRYRIILCSFLDWDSEDEDDQNEPVVLAPEAPEAAEPSELDEIGFDNVEAIEAKADAEDTAAEHCFEFSRAKRGTVFSYSPKLSSRKAPEADEPEPSADDSALFADFAAELD